MKECIYRDDLLSLYEGEYSDEHYNVPVPVIIQNIKDMPAANVVSSAAYDQVDWERCVAISQLKEIGKGLGERMDDVTTVVRCRECIHWKKSELVISGAHDMVCDFHMGARYCRHADDFCSKGEKADNE